VAPQVRVSSEGTQDVVGAAHEQLPQHLVSFLGDVFLRIPIPRAVGGWHQPQVRSDRAALFEAVGVFQRQHEGKRRKRSDSLHLAQEVGFVWVVLLRDRLQLPLVVPDPLGQRADLLQDGLEGRQKRLGDVLSAALLWKLLAGHLGKRAPKDLTAPRTLG
jgi:hypothetical protein